MEADFLYCNSDLDHIHLGSNPKLPQNSASICLNKRKHSAETEFLFLETETLTLITDS